MVSKPVILPANQNCLEKVALKFYSEYPDGFFEV